MDQVDRKSLENKPHILIVDNSVAITGALKAIVNAAKALNSVCQFVFVLPEKSSAIPFIQLQGFKVEQLPFVELSKRKKDLLLYFPVLIKNGLKLKTIACKYNAKVIHMNDFYNLTGIVAKLAGCSASLITHVRFMPQRFTPALARFWAGVNLKYTHKIICVSEAVKAFFKESEKIFVIPDPIPEKESHYPKQIKPKEDQIINLLYLSNFIKGKGQDHALAAFQVAYNQNPDLRLTFAGGDMGLEKNRDFKKSLQEVVIKNGVEKVVFFKSFVIDVEEEIKAADILLNFSESESFSLTCLDALFYGTPLIATDCGGPAELFENEVSGLLVENMNINAMAIAIVKLSVDLEKRKAFSENGKKYVRVKFSPANSYLKLEEIYHYALKAAN